jgi:DNA-binding CsgD family transcriptional regulator
MTDGQGRAGGWDGGSALLAAGTDFYRDLSLTRVLHGVIAHSSELLGASAGSLSLLDPARGRYTKVAEHGASCRLGQSFPLDEGVTGEVVARRAPVLLRRYGDLRTGHLPAGHPVGDGSVAAVPIWWRGDVIGVNVVFAGRRRRFGRAEVDELDLLTQSAAAAIVAARTGGGYLDATAAARASGPGAGAAGHHLTPRELEVLGLLCQGMGDRRAAARLGISVKTVEKHVGALLRKTGTTNRTAAVVHALSHGLLAAADPAPG